MENKKEPLMSVKEWFSENTDKIPTAEERILITKYANYVTQWQQQQNKNLYSEEEVIKILIECCGEVSCEDGALVGKSPAELVEWIDTKFKKK